MLYITYCIYDIPDVPHGFLWTDHFETLQSRAPIELDPEFRATRKIFRKIMVNLKTQLLSPCLGFNLQQAGENFIRNIQLSSLENFPALECSSTRLNTFCSAIGPWCEATWSRAHCSTRKWKKVRLGVSASDMWRSWTTNAGSYMFSSDPLVNGLT